MKQSGNRHWLQGILGVLCAAGSLFSGEHRVITLPSLHSPGGDSSLKSPSVSGKLSSVRMFGQIGYPDERPGLLPWQLECPDFPEIRSIERNKTVSMTQWELAALRSAAHGGDAVKAYKLTESLLRRKRDPLVQKWQKTLLQIRREAQKQLPENAGGRLLRQAVAALQRKQGQLALHLVMLAHGRYGEAEYSEKDWTGRIFQMAMREFSREQLLPEKPSSERENEPGGEIPGEEMSPAFARTCLPMLCPDSPWKTVGRLERYLQNHPQSRFAAFRNVTVFALGIPLQMGKEMAQLGETVSAWQSADAIPALTSLMRMKLWYEGAVLTELPVTSWANEGWLETSWGKLALALQAESMTSEQYLAWAPVVETEASDWALFAGPVVSRWAARASAQLCEDGRALDAARLTAALVSHPAVCLLREYRGLLELHESNLNAAGFPEAAALVRRWRDAAPELTPAKPQDLSLPKTGGEKDSGLDTVPFPAIPKR